MGRTARTWLAGVVLAALLGGCGIPDNTEVVQRGAGPSAGLSPGADNTVVRRLRLDTTDRAQFVANYLEAAAGDHEGAIKRVSEFLDPSARAIFKPSELRVVRLTEQPLINPGSPEVRLRVQQVGVLRADGVLEPSSSAADSEYRLAVSEVNGATGLFVTQTPPVMLLSDTALLSFYQRRIIYFWNQARTTLVPDVRYLPLSVPTEQQPNEIIKWLTTGPAPWISGVVEPLPPGTEVIGNVPASSGQKLQVNLTGQALPPDDDKALDRLRDQLMWSLRPNLPQQVELKIDHQLQGVFSDTAYLPSNPAYRFADAPQRFCVYAGRIHRLAKSANPADPVPPIISQVNRNVRTVAMGNSGTLTYAALVADDGGRQVLRVGSGPPGAPATFHSAPLPAPVGRPAWAVTPAGGESGNAVGLVPAAGRLYSFAADGGGPRPVDWEGGPASITSVAIAPDGHRIAVVAGGRLYLAVMTGSGSGNGMQISEPRLIRTSMRDLTAVDWSSDASVVVAGLLSDAQRFGRVAIVDTTIDGVSQLERLPDLGTAKVTHLVAYPANPANGQGNANSVAYVADNVAYDALAGPVRIAAGDLAAPTPGVPASTAPTAPFFLN